VGCLLLGSCVGSLDASMYERAERMWRSGTILYSFNTLQCKGMHQQLNAHKESLTGTHVNI